MKDFEIEEAPKRETVPAPAVKAEEPDLFTQMLAGKAVTKSIETSRGAFKVRYPTGRDRIRIDQVKALRYGGMSASSFDVTAHYNNEVYSTLDVVVIDGPEWWKEAKKKNLQWTWEDCPDEELVVELYHQVDTFRGLVQSSLRKVRPSGGDEPSPSGSADEAVADGAFSDLTNGPADKRGQ